MNNNSKKNISSQKISTAQIIHIANLAAIPITKVEEEELRLAFEQTLNTIAELQSVDISNIEPTHQVTGFENILREDKVNQENMFSQKEALKNAKETHAGYFVVPRVLTHE
ncbi:MAG: Asp-tRNA(Asn)/Glu-tRNA(Gln) amidotransferase subunit GatC [Pseudomonadales bacterium]|nr:Asp-tRNA(Asn)/Glu-tRNA(Gln) amidotransferase subunit GatC [Pseudomonadales bacterium]